MLRIASKPIIRTVRSLRPATCSRLYSTQDAEESEYSVDVHNLSDRWEKMPADDQQDLINYLEVKQRFAWPHLTRDEKRATYYISYGSWGPRNDKRLSSGEVLFKSLTTLFLFGVVAFAVVNYKKDEKERSALTEHAKEASEASEASEAPEGSGAAQ